MEGVGAGEEIANTQHIAVAGHNGDDPWKRGGKKYADDEGIRLMRRNGDVDEGCYLEVG